MESRERRLSGSLDKVLRGFFALSLKSDWRLIVAWLLWCSIQSRLPSAALGPFFHSRFTSLSYFQPCLSLLVLLATSSHSLALELRVCLIFSPLHRSPPPINKNASHPSSGCHGSTYSELWMNSSWWVHWATALWNVLEMQILNSLNVTRNVGLNKPSLWIDCIFSFESCCLI